MNLLLLLSPFCTLFFAQCGFAASPTNNLDIRLKTGVFRGVSANGTEKWLGIPFAQPPIGPLRFKAPLPIVKTSNAIKDASKFGNVCPQPADPTLNAPTSEDCLFLNVWRPQNVDPNVKLPILLWIHGGAYTTGASSQTGFDPTDIVKRSAEIGRPIVFVSNNYRMNTFGFLASGNVPPEDLNAGLLDQRVALEFVQDNIAAFGGDPSKVTIWGESAGAGSVQAHFLYPANRSLFRAGILDSTTGPFKNSPPATTYDKPGKPFTRLLSATGCSAGRNAISCLQNVPFETLMNISNVMIDATLNQQLWQPSIGPVGSLIPEEASARVKRGDFLRLPFIIGTNVNEGTVFSPTLLNLGLRGPSETAAFDNFIGHLVIDNSTITTEVLDEFHRLYPANDPSLGAPFNQGDSLFDRASAWYTDIMFLAPTRLFSQHAAQLQPTYVYRFAEFILGNDPTFGVSHTSELQLLFGPIPPIASIEQGLAAQMRDFYINFVYDLTPGVQWPKYPRGVLQLQRDNITVIPDDFDLVKTNFLNTDRVLSEFEK
ncbi:alpha/beta-hydrolase [Crucibulum laeve]|uniref:Carboxylic ester hydrolase n=1 Tax=Crucibulum laeve TaxID=68775 RepID=A0A5C3M3A9_9AGAR|nr:alpha/beta-hydrolase [Crucibulum laeve]